MPDLSAWILRHGRSHELEVSRVSSLSAPAARPQIDLPAADNPWAADPPWDWTTVPAPDGIASDFLNVSNAASAVFAFRSAKKWREDHKSGRAGGATHKVTA